MKILVTGANGLLGRKLVSRIAVNPEFTCIATLRHKPQLHANRPNLRFVKLDLLHTAEIHNILNEHLPEVIIHTAAMTQADECEQQRDLCNRVNVDAVKSLVEICLRMKIHLIQLSTDFVFDGKHGPYHEDEKPNPVNFYGESKFRAEEIILKTLPGSTIIRTILVYGINQFMSRSNVLLWVKKSLEKKEKIRVVDDQIRNPVLVDDLAKGCIAAAILKKAGIFHLGGREFLTPFRFANLIADYYGLDKTLIIPVNADTFSQPAERPLITGLITSKAEKELGFDPLFIRNGLDLITKEMKKYQLQ
jgi:dTDP-4-dehydrorhamnose reductase